MSWGGPYQKEVSSTALLAGFSSEIVDSTNQMPEQEQRPQLGKSVESPIKRKKKRKKRFSIAVVSFSLLKLYTVPRSDDTTLQIERHSFPAKVSVVLKRTLPDDGSTAQLDYMHVPSSLSPCMSAYVSECINDPKKTRKCHPNSNVNALVTFLGFLNFLNKVS